MHGQDAPSFGLEVGVFGFGLKKKFLDLREISKTKKKKVFLEKH